MTHTVFSCPECGQKFKVSGGAHSCGLYAFSKSDMDYNLLEKIDESGKDRVRKGAKRAVSYDDHISHKSEFAVETTDDRIHSL